MLFNPVLEDVAPNDEKLEDKDNDVDNGNESNTIPFIPDTRSVSTLRRISEISLQSITTKYQHFFLVASSIIIFMMGVVVGASTVKIFVCFDPLDEQVSLTKILINVVFLLKIVRRCPFCFSLQVLAFALRGGPPTRV